MSFRDRSIRNTQTVSDSVVFGSVILVQGVNGAVTITTDRPRYRVQDWPSAPAWPSVAQARAQPSRLLQPRRQVVGFAGRTAELASFSEWADSEADMAVRLIHAPGGQGKTRLALHLAAAAADAGWAVWDTEPNAASGTPADQCPLPTNRRVLVVADYADRWPTDHLLALLGDLRTVGGEASVVVRVLLLARSAKLWWPSLAEQLDTRHDVPADAVPLAPLGDQVDAGVLFETAAMSFAQCLDVAVPDRLEVPEHPARLSSLLAVHMAALAAVDARRRRVPAPGSMHAVSAYLLSREQTHWRALHRRAEDGYRTDALTMRRTAYLATLLGSLPRTAARASLTAVGIAGAPAEADRIIDDHTVCYPPAKRDEVLEPIQPDRLGEDFIALVTPGHGYDDETAWLCDDWTIDAAGQLFTGDPLWATAALPVLVEAASRWPHLVSEVVCPLLRRRPELALAAGGTVLARIAGLEGVDPAVLLAVEQQLPNTPDAGLDVGAAALSVALYEHRLSVTPDPVERARVHYDYAERLARVARYQEAITALYEAIAIYLPRTAEGEPQVTLGLVAALTACGGDLAAIGRLDEAITVTAQAYSIVQQIAAGDPELQTAFLPLIATPTHNLGRFLCSEGRLEEARTLFEQAVAIWRRLDSEELQRSRASLALSLMGLAMTLNELGDAGSAAAAAEEAFSIRRALAEADPAAYLPDLAGTLSSLAAFAVDTESTDRTLTLLREGIEIFRRLADLNPAVYRPLLALAYANLGSMLTRLDRLTEAVEVTEEAVAMFRAARESNPAGHRDWYCSSLRNLGLLLTWLQRWEEARSAIVESLPMIRERAADQRLSRLDDLEKSLTGLFAAAWELGRFDEALAAAQEAIDLGLRLVEHDTAAYLPRLGHSLLRVGLVLQQDDRCAEASVALEEATGIFRGLAVAHSGGESKDLAAALVNLAGCLTALERPAEAVVLAAEAAEIYRRLSDRQPTLYEPLLAQSLWECARAGLATGRQLPAALARAYAAVQPLRAHTVEQPVLSTLLFDVIQTMADLHDALGRPDEAADLRHQVGEAKAGRATTITVRQLDAATPVEEPPAAAGSMDAALLNDGAECYRRGDVAGAFGAWFVVSMTRNPVWAPKAEYYLGILFAEQGNACDAGLFFRRVADGTDPELAPKAAMRLAALLREADDLDGARAACRTAYRAAIQAADQAVATQAMSGLSGLLENDDNLAQAAAVLWGAFRAGDSAAMQELGRMWLRHDDPGAAAAALRHAANLGDPPATFSLGLVLQQQGDFDGARAAYWHAVQMPDPHYSSLALLKLGVLHFEQGDWAGAQELWQRCFDARQPHSAPLAAANLGMLLHQTGDVAGVQAAWQYVINNGEPDLVARVAIDLGDLLSEHGDQDGAHTAWQTTVDTGRPDYAPEAAIRLGREAEERGDFAAARRAWEVAVSTTDADRRKAAWMMLGEALRRDGDSTGAVDAFRSAVELGDIGGVASLSLGQLLADVGDIQGARAAYEQAAAAAPDSACAASALLNLGLLFGDGDREAARAAWAQAADTGDGGSAARAAFNIAVLLREDGDIPGAHAAFHRAMAMRDPEITPYAALGLGNLHTDDGAVDQAHAAYRMAIDSAHPKYAPLASLRLGASLWGAGRLDEANRAFAYAVEMGDPETAARARQALDDLTSDRRIDPHSRQR